MTLYLGIKTRRQNYILTTFQIRIKHVKNLPVSVKKKKKEKKEFLIQNYLNGILPLFQNCKILLKHSE